MADRAFVDLHCHTSASFDSLAKPASVIDAAAKRGLTHLAITDHGTIDGALAARAAAPPEIAIIVGEEIRTAEGDLIALFLQTAVAQHRPAKETIDEVRAQGGLVGVPHPFDRFRGSLLRDAQMASLAPLVDWVEVHNARIVGGSGNEQATLFAREHGLHGVAVSDAHSTLEVGVAYATLDGDPSTAGGLLDALAGDVGLVTGRASYYVRTFTPIAKLVHRLRPG